MIEVLFFCSASKAIGFGHLRRLASISQAIRKTSLKKSLIVRPDPQLGELPSELKSAFASFHKLDLIRALTNRLSPFILIVDDYRITNSELRFLESMRDNTPIVFIDDGLNSVPKNTKICIQPNPRSKAPKIDGTTLSGLKFVPVNPTITGKTTKKSNTHILITMGGSDSLGITSALARNLAVEFPNESFVVVFGPLALATADTTLHEVENITIYSAPDNFFELMASSKMVISAAGTTVYELGTLRIPSVFLVVADNQLGIFDAAPFNNWFKVFDARANIYEAIPAIAGAVREFLVMTPESKSTLIFPEDLDGMGAYRIGHKIVELADDI